MVYFITDGIGNVKIGYVRGSDGKYNIENRLVSLQIGNANKLEVLTVAEGTKAHESYLHEKFSDFHLRGEWFLLKDPIMDYIHLCQRNSRTIEAEYRPYDTRYFIFESN